jgi:ubiquinone/menaquinone biosynthesis C-methylase UbiE
MSDFDARARTWDQDAAKLERAARVADELRRKVPLRKEDSVLDYGCGTGLLGFALLPHVGHVTMADTSREMLAVVVEKIAAAGLPHVVTAHLAPGATALPGGPYDLACTLMTLHHVPDTDALLAQFHAALRPGGYLGVADLDAEDGSFHGEGFDGHRGFDRADLGRRLEQAGFTAITFTTAFEVVKGEGLHQRRYPVFLAVARRG